MWFHSLWINTNGCMPSGQLRNSCSHSKAEIIQFALVLSAVEGLEPTTMLETFHGLLRCLFNYSIVKIPCLQNSQACWNKIQFRSLTWVIAWSEFLKIAVWTCAKQWFSSSVPKKCVGGCFFLIHLSLPVLHPLYLTKPLTLSLMLCSVSGLRGLNVTI